MPGLWIDRLVPETVRIHQGSETIVMAAALGRLRAEDERMAGDAEAALGSLAWDRGLQAITQHGLQAFLWHELPRKWLTDRRQAAHRRFAGAVAGAGRARPLHGDLPWAPDRRGAAGLRGRRPGGLPGVPPGAGALRVELPDLPGPRLCFA